MRYFFYAMTKKIIFILSGLLILAVFAVAEYKFLNKGRDAEDISIAEELKSDGVVLSKEDILPSDAIITVKTAEGFVPAEVTVKVHSRVVWVNNSATYIWPASNPHPTHTDFPEFDAKQPLEPGKAWGFVFDRTGNWGYHDHLRPSQRGIVHVIE